MIYNVKNDMGYPFLPVALKFNEGAEEDIHIQMYELGEISTTMMISTLDYCQRKMWYTYHTKIGVPLSSIFSMELGTMVHGGFEKAVGKKVVSDKLNEMNLDMHAEVGQSTYIKQVDRELRGKVDLLVLNTDTGEITIYDYKFTSSYFRYLPKTTHLLQLLIYKFIFERELYKHLDNSLKFSKPALVYINPAARDNKFNKIATVDSYQDVAQNYYEKKRKDRRMKDDEFAYRYGEFKKKAFYFYDSENDAYSAIKDIGQYILAGLTVAGQIAQSFDEDEWGARCREGYFAGREYHEEKKRLAEEGHPLANKELYGEKSWRCQYCSYFSICEERREDVTPKTPEIELISTDSKKFAKKHDVPLEDWGK